MAADRSNAIPVRREAYVVALGDDAGRAGDRVRRRRLLVPLAILFRYSFDKVDARRIMIETFSFDNYVKFFSDPYYTGVLARHCGWPRFVRSSVSPWVCRSPTCWRAPSRVSRT
jgi:hypothetical protein